MKSQGEVVIKIPDVYYVENLTSITADKLLNAALDFFTDKLKCHAQKITLSPTNHMTFP